MTKIQVLIVALVIVMATLLAFVGTALATITVSEKACTDGGGTAGSVFCIGGKWNGKLLH